MTKFLPKSLRALKLYNPSILVKVRKIFSKNLTGVVLETLESPQCFLFAKLMFILENNQ